MKTICVLLLVIAFAGLTSFTNGQSNTFPGNNQQRPARPSRPRPAVTGGTTARPASTTLPPPNPEVPVVYTVKCACPFTPEYNPVCGSDGQTYGNRQILNCARTCGANVNFVVGGGCGQNRG